MFELRAALARQTLSIGPGVPLMHAVLASRAFRLRREMPETARCSVAAPGGDRGGQGATAAGAVMQLHVSYGNALMATRGHTARREGKRSPRRASLAIVDKDAPGRLSADYGFWVGSYTRGRLVVDAGARNDFSQRPANASPEAKRRPSRRRNYVVCG